MSKTEYIEREKLIRHLEDEIAGCKVPAGSRANGKSIAYGTALGLKMAKSFAETLPGVEVVRCEDCEYCEVLEMDYGGKQYWCKFWSTPKREYAEGYCCHGERR